MFGKFFTKQPRKAPIAAKTLNDQKDQRGVLAKISNHALTKGGFDDVIERLSTPDRKRIGDFAKRDFADLDGRVDQIRKNWTTKYGKDFDMTEALFADFTVLLNDARNVYLSALSSMPALWQQADALALQHLDALLSLEAGAMGLTKDILMRDLFFATLSTSNGV